MNILTDEAIELLGQVKIPCDLEVTVLTPKQSRWQRFLYRLLGYEVRVGITILEPDTQVILDDIGLFSMVVGDTTTVNGLYTGTEVILPGVKKGGNRQ